MPSRPSPRHGVAAVLSVLGLSACANVIGLTDLHDGICTPGATQECPYTGPPGTKDVGICKAATQVCAGDGQSWGSCYGQILPLPAEDCTTPVDDNCNGQVNEPSAGCCTAPSTVSCYDGPAGTEGVGNCVGGMKTCSATTDAYGTCMGEVVPVKEDCYTKGDEDCDGNACSDPVWDLVFNDSNGESVTGLALDSKGDIYIAGSFNYYLGVDGQMFPDANPSSGMSQYYLVKLDHQAPHHLLWHKLLGDDQNNGTNIRTVVDKDDNIIIAGDVRSSIDFGGGTKTSSSVSAFVAKYDSQGTYQWGEIFGGTAGAAATTVSTDSTGNIILGGAWYGGTLDFGTTMLTAPASGYGFVAGFTPAGVNTWSISLSDGSSSPPAGMVIGVTAVAVAPADPNTIFVTGTFNKSLQLGTMKYPTAGQDDVFLARLDGTGSVVWGTTFGSGAEDRSNAISASAAGNVAISGTYGAKITVGTTVLTPTAGHSDGFAAAFDGTGAPLWSTGFSGATNASSPFVSFDVKGNCFVLTDVAGDANLGGGPLVSTGPADLVLAKLDGQGGVLWNKLFGSSQAGLIASGLGLDPSTGNVAIAGRLGGNGNISFGLLPLTGNYNALFAEFQY